MKNLILIIFVLAINPAKSQTVTNGDFSSAATGWNCNPETNPENVYGGGTSNMVAEVDELAGLCQTIGGFVVGNAYRISLNYSRRTGGCPGPNPAAATISLSNGALTAGISSSVGSYSLQSAAFTFTATRTTLTLSITANFVGTTCGLIIDNVSIMPYNPLPIELTYFSAVAGQDQDVLEWQTASQHNNDFFAIERSTDAMNWQKIRRVEAAGNSLQTNHYSIIMNETLHGIYYYRLKQTDYNKRFSYSSIVSVDRKTVDDLLLFPNPVGNVVYLNSPDSKGFSVSGISSSGTENRLDYTVNDAVISINTSELSNGIYVLKLSLSGKEYYKKILVSRD